MGRAAANHADGALLVDLTAVNLADGTPRVDQAAVNRADGAPLVDRAAANCSDDLPCRSCVDRAAANHADGAPLVDRAAVNLADGAPRADRADVNFADGAPRVGRAAVNHADGATCIDRSADNRCCELPPACARPLCAARTLAEVVADSTPFQNVSRRRSRREQPGSVAAGPSKGNNEKKPSHIIGSGDSRLAGGIQAAMARGRQPITGGLFVSRLAPNTSATSLKRHIKDTCNVTAKCVAIKTKYDSYCSFRVLSDSHLDRLLDHSVWPKGVLVRDFI